MTKIRFDYAERRAYNRLMNSRGLHKSISQPDFIELVDTYLKQTKHTDGLSEVSIWDTSRGDRVYLTYWYVKNDSYKKLMHMTEVSKIMKNHYSLVDFEEFGGDHVRLEMTNHVSNQEALEE